MYRSRNASGGMSNLNKSMTYYNKNYVPFLFNYKYYANHMPTDSLTDAILPY